MKLNLAMKYNRRIYPGFKALSWDPLFYSPIIFLFLSEVKGLSAAHIMYAESFSTLFLFLSQIPAEILIEKIGQKKSLILGCFFVTLQIGMMVIANSFSILILAYCFSAFGTALKEIASPTLLFDSTKICVVKIPLQI